MGTLILFKNFKGYLKWRSYIKLPKKSFEDLSDNDLILMIDAHLNEGNSSFEEPALAEFCLMRYSNPRLESFRVEVSEILERYREDFDVDWHVSYAEREALLAIADKLSDSAHRT